MTGSFIRVLSAFFALVAAGIFFHLPPCLANFVAPWETAIIGHDNSPPRLIAVDKKRQHIFVYERNSPIRLVTSYLCTTGQAPGDKIREGDLKTPEGVYFIVQHLTSGLDFEMYGKEAYPLNYPNPVDKLRRKTGYGIWIHGRGYDIAPLQTQGCVALNNPDLSTLGNYIAMGMPVVLSNTLRHTENPAPEIAVTVATLEKLVKGWAKAWAGRSSTLFDYYNQDAYSIATEPFSAFRKQKERLFKSLPWIKTTVSDIQVLQGPGYWVTWFHQDYEAPNLATKGVRRLYWEESPEGKFKIIGMEWVPGLTTGPLVALAEAPVPPLEAHPRTEPVAEQAPARASSLTEAELLAEAPVVADRAPSPQQGRQEPEGKAADLDRLIAVIDNRAKNPPPTQTQADIPASEERDAETPIPVPIPSEQFATADAASPAGSDITLLAPAITQRIEEWRIMWERGNVDGYMGFYHNSARQGSRSSAKSIKKHKTSLWKNAAPSTVTLDDIRISLVGDAVKAEMYQKYTDVTGAGDTGIKLLLFKNSNGRWLIIEEKWSPLAP